MTTAIEQAKREMYAKFVSTPSCRARDEFESALESLLEQMRQQYEEMALTARQRFESIQSMESANLKLEAENQRLESLNMSLEVLRKSLQGLADNHAAGYWRISDQLDKMTESRDMFRNLHQAATHASIGYVGMPRTSGQTSGDRASCEQLGAQKVAMEWGGEGLPPVGERICEYLGAHQYDEWSVVNIFAHWGDQVFVDYGDGWRAERDLERFRPIRTPEQIAAEERDAGIKSILDDYVHTEGSCTFHLTSKQAARIYDAGYRKPTCMHSFFSIGDDQMKCTFCGVGK